MNQKLKDYKVAIVATDGFEQQELLEPKKALEEAGAKVDLISLRSGRIRGWKKKNWGRTVQVDGTFRDRDPRGYDALVLPGGVINADSLRVSKDAVRFVTHFAGAGKPIAAICHGAWILIETGFINGRKMTSWPSLKTDLLNASANWADEAVIVDGGWVTSRKPDDLPAFNRQMIEEIYQSRYAAHADDGKSFERASA